MATDMAEKKYSLISFGEAYLRFSPALGKGYVSDCESGKTSPSPALTDEEASTVVQTIGGSELSLCEALAQLGHKTSWISVVPASPIGDSIIAGGRIKGVHMDNVGRPEIGDIGTVHIGRGRDSEHHQRSNTAFARLDPNTISWDVYLAESQWLSMSTETMMLGTGPCEVWKAGLVMAQKRSISTCVAFHSDPSLGMLDRTLYTISPYLPSVTVLVIDYQTAEELTVMHRPQKGDMRHIDWLAEGVEVAVNLQAVLKSELVAITCCIPSKDGFQKRFSILAKKGGFTCSTASAAIEHRHTPSIGRSDLWWAGFLDVILTTGESNPLENHSLLAKAARYGDLFVALQPNPVTGLVSISRGQLNTAAEALKFDSN